MTRDGRNAAWMILPVVLVSYSIAEGFTGNEWRDLSEIGRNYYVAGVVDTWAQVVKAEEMTGEHTALAAPYKVLMDCILSKKMPYSQIVAIVKRYMDEHPEEWGSGMTALVFVAMFSNGCR